MKKKTNKNGIFYVVISLVAILAVGTGVFAYAVSNNVNVEGDYNYFESENQPAPDEELIGAVSGPDYYWDYQNFNGLTTFVKTGGFRVASTTLAAIQNPLHETSTLDLAILDISGVATTTIMFQVTTSTDQYFKSGELGTGVIIAKSEANAVPTSTTAHIVSGVNIETGTGGNNDGSASEQRVAIGPSEWVVVKVFTINDAYDSAITELTSSLKGQYTFRFFR